MTEKQNTTNAITGSVIGSVVQAGAVILPTPADQGPVPRQLPPGLPDFTGRAEQVAALDALLVGHAPAIAVVNGTGGAGKTSLAVQWSHRVQDQFPDGTLFVDLRGYGPAAPLHPSVALTSFLSSLGVPGSVVPARLDAQAGLYRSVLAGRRTLIVLDNALDGAQVQPLLPGSPGCVTIVTSRDALTELVVSRAARPVDLPPFTGEQSLLLARGLVGPDRVDAEPEAVAELVRVCGGLPLAVRIAAARALTRPRNSLAEVVADLTTESSGLTSAMQVVFDWSYARLPATTARVFRRLGAHPGPEFGVAAVAALTALAPEAAYDALERLVELRLLEPIGRRRYRIHDLLHAYAARRTDHDDTAEQRQESVARLLTWYAGAVRRADRAAFPALAGVAELAVPGELPAFTGRTDALAWLRTEQDTVTAAVRLAAKDERHELVLALAAGVRFLSWQGFGLAEVCLELLSLGLAAALATGDRAAECLFRVLRGETLWSLGRLAEAEAEFEGALAEPARRVDGLAGLGWVRLAQGRPAEARKYYLAALPLAAGDERTEAVVHAQLSRIHTRLGDFAQALVHADRELALRRQARDEPGEAYALHTAALARQGTGDHETAIRLCRRAIARHRELDDVGRDLADALLTLAECLESVGEDCTVCRTEALTVLTALGDPRAEELRRVIGQSHKPGTPEAPDRRSRGSRG
ncbi:ATP-binding protein [Amycolatopsis sp. cmx-4-83]|uniref:ATP-binding protein n=1 Tax=Amycolatopsis sp. cmx-4-83 TaxID=2790940 RepID=UPI003979955F